MSICELLEGSTCEYPKADLIGSEIERIPFIKIVTLVPAS